MGAILKKVDFLIFRILLTFFLYKDLKNETEKPNIYQIYLIDQLRKVVLKHPLRNGQKTKHNILQAIPLFSRCISNYGFTGKYNSIIEKK